jgi:PAP2 superfamily
MLRSWLSSPHSGVHEIGGLVVLYAVYEVVRGVGGEDWRAALDHTDDIVALEQSLGLFVERAVQDAVTGITLLPALLGAAYVVLHFLGTAAAIVWVHRRHRSAYPLVRTTLIASTAIALVGYVVYPAAPPRLSDLGFVDTVTHSTGLNLSSDLLGGLYNPIAAVPSLHFGYSVIVGAAMLALASRRVVRIAGVLYPVVMLFVIVATGNHFLFDAAAGGLTVALAWLVARRLVARPARASLALGPGTA